jgi:hypothetical protein
LKITKQEDTIVQREAKQEQEFAVVQREAYLNKALQANIYKVLIVISKTVKELSLDASNKHLQ